MSLQNRTSESEVTKTPSIRGPSGAIASVALLFMFVMGQALFLAYYFGT